MKPMNAVRHLSPFVLSLVLLAPTAAFAQDDSETKAADEEAAVLPPTNLEEPKPSKKMAPAPDVRSDEPPETAEPAEARGDQPVDADDFDLETVMSLIREEKVSSAEELEKIINEDNGINNIDLDGDEIVDHVIVRETRAGDTTKFEFVAVPSASPNDTSQRVVLGSLSFEERREAKEVEVVGAYHDHNVYHPEHHVYVYTVVHPYYVARPHPFCAWVYSPGRSIYWVSYTPVYYHTHYRHSRTVFVSRRSHFHRRTSFRPVPRRARTRTYYRSGPRSRSRATRTTYRSSRSRAARPARTRSARPTRTTRGTSDRTRPSSNKSTRRTRSDDNASTSSRRSRSDAVAPPSSRRYEGSSKSRTSRSKKKSRAKKRSRSRVRSRSSRSRSRSRSSRSRRSRRR